MTGSLEGIRVLELARYQAGPRCGMLLSDLGAEVIKIESIGGEGTRRQPPLVRGQSAYFGAYNRGKKSLCLNLRSDEGKKIFAGLVAKSDIVLENFRPGTMAAMGFGYSDLKALNPGIILVSASAFGQTGPYRDRPGFDPLGQAMSGLMWLTGKRFGEPVATAASVVDRITALHATIGALAALRHRERTGEGQMIDVCLMDSALTLTEIPATYRAATGEDAGEDGRGAFKAKDGWLVIIAQPESWRKLLSFIKGREVEVDGYYSVFPGSGDNRREILREWCAERPISEISQALEALDIPYAPCLTIPEVATDPHGWEREMFVKLDDPVAGEMVLPGNAIKMSGTPGMPGPISQPGQHTDVLLSEILGLDDGVLTELRAAKVIL